MIKALILGGCLLAASLTFAGQDATIKKLMQKKSDEFVAAFKAKNVGWFEKTSTDDLTDTENGKTYTKKDAVAQMKQMFTVMTSSDVSEKILNIKMDGKKVIVTAKTHVAATIKSPNGTPTKLDITSTGEEVWVPVAGDYKLKSMKSLHQEALVNGKPFKGAM